MKMKAISLVCSFWLSLFLVFGCKQKPVVNSFVDSKENVEWIHAFTDDLNKAIVNDIFSPPVASRIYAYTYLAGYIPFDRLNQSLEISGLNTKLDISLNGDYDPLLTALYAMEKVSRELVFSRNYLEAYRVKLDSLTDEINLNPKVIAASSEAASQILGALKRQLISVDNYAETRTMQKYEIKNPKPGQWIPTPPDYLDALEPHWSKIVPLYLDSSSQFAPKLQVKYDMNSSSRFYTDLQELYSYTRDSLDETKTEIAEFWDCNPFVVEHNGHFMRSVKKITPGGHWIGINKIVSKDKKLDAKSTLRNYCMLSMSMMDGFISCWGEKYNSSLIRPETLINLHIDPEWKPLLYTPPFPEYTSGHSVVSGVASTVLTALYGDNVAFIDDTETEFGLPIRSFRSFNQAAEEAAISRYYGGIHYKPAIYDGLKQGRSIGNYFIERFNLK